MLAGLHLASLDGRASEEITDLRWAPATHVMELASSWWIKGPLFVLVALICDLLVARRRLSLPCLAPLTLASVVAGSIVSNLIKPLIDRPRPPLGHAGISAIGQLPATASFPSGHATTAFAAAAAIAIARPSLRVWALVVAATVALSRVYLGMHYLGDVLAGALLGSAIGAAIVLAGRRALPSGMTRVLRTA